MKRILVVTDCVDIAASELRAVLVSQLDVLGTAHEISIEPIVEVVPFSVLHGSFCLRLLAESYNPEELTILAIVNPLDTSNTKRARIAGKLHNGIQFVGANTGIFSWLIEDFGLAELCETDATGLKGSDFISFGGKYIHAPIAANFASTADLNSVKIGDFSEQDLLKVEYAQGTVVHIDNFGVIKLMHKDQQLAATPGDKFNLSINNEVISTGTYCKSMKECNDGELAIYKGSSLDLLEIGLVRELETAKTLGIEIGDVVKLVPAH